MKIQHEKVFKPLTITIETQDEYNAFVEIIDEAEDKPESRKAYMGHEAIDLALKLSDYFTNSK